MECPVCFTVFKNDIGRPRNLPCGHTFCTECLSNMVQKDKVTCPTCRVLHTVPQLDHLPINYPLEAIIKTFKNAFPTPAISDQKEVFWRVVTNQKYTKGLSRSVEFLLQEQKTKAMVAITACQEMKLQLDQYQASLVSWKDEQQELKNRLQIIMDNLENAKVLIEKEETQVVAKKEEVQQMEQQLHAVLDTLHKVSSDQEAGAAIVDVTRCSDEAKERVEEFWEMFPDVHSITTAKKMMVTSKMAVSVSEVLKAGDHFQENTGLSAEPIFTLKEKLQALMTPNLGPEDLCTLSQSATILLRAGLVFAIHKTEGQIRYARITLEDGKQYLHCLREQTLPFAAATLQMEEVVPASFPYLVFLDLVWPGTDPCRVVIHLSPDTPLGRQFVLMCTGQQGSSYLNTNLHQVVNKTTPDEFVCGGDYDGSGGAALLPDLDKGQYREGDGAGDVFRLVRTRIGYSDWNTRFGIVVGNYKGSCVFGKVVDGLDDVRAAAKHNPIKEVKVIDCGVVLWEKCNTNTTVSCFTQEGAGQGHKKQKKKKKKATKALSFQR